MYAIFMCSSNWYPLICVDIKNTLGEAETCKASYRKKTGKNIGVHLIED